MRRRAANLGIIHTEGRARHFNGPLHNRLGVCVPAQSLIHSRDCVQIGNDHRVRVAPRQGIGRQHFVEQGLGIRRPPRLVVEFHQVSEGVSVAWIFFAERAAEGVRDLSQHELGVRENMVASIQRRQPPAERRQIEQYIGDVLMGVSAGTRRSEGALGKYLGFRILAHVGVYRGLIAQEGGEYGIFLTEGRARRFDRPLHNRLGGCGTTQSFR